VPQVCQQAIARIACQRIDDRLAAFDRREAYPPGRPLDILQAQRADLFRAYPVGIEQLDDGVVAQSDGFLPVNAVQQPLCGFVVDPARDRTELIPAKAGNRRRQIPVQVAPPETERQEL